MGPLQGAHWDIQNKSISNHQLNWIFFLDVPVGSLLSSMVDFFTVQTVSCKGPITGRLRAVLLFSSDHASKATAKVCKLEKWTRRVLEEGGIPAYLAGRGFVVRSIHRARSLSRYST